MNILVDVNFMQKNSGYVDYPVLKFSALEIFGCQWDLRNFSWVETIQVEMERVGIVQVGIIRVGIVRSGTFLGWNCAGGSYPSENNPGGNYSGGNYPVGNWCFTTASPYMFLKNSRYFYKDSFKNTRMWLYLLFQS